MWLVRRRALAAGGWEKDNLRDIGRGREGGRGRDERKKRDRKRKKEREDQKGRSARFLWF